MAARCQRPMRTDAAAYRSSSQRWRVCVERGLGTRGWQTVERAAAPTPGVEIGGNDEGGAL
jgi:hypothetical protein